MSPNESAKQRAALSESLLGLKLGASLMAFLTNLVGIASGIVGIFEHSAYHVAVGCLLLILADR